MTASDPESPSAHAAQATDRRVGELTGPRICLKCGYSLMGQPVMREQHYDMLMVRCPECGTVAALQEYPALGRWGNRWAGALAGLWFLLLVGALVICSVTLSVFTLNTGNTAAVGYMEWLGQHQYDWMVANNDPDFEQYFGQQAYYTDASQYYWYFDRDWWRAHDADALLAEAGGWAAIADWSALRNWIWVFLWSIVFGMFWAVMLMRFGWRRLLGFGGLILAVAFGMSFLISLPTLGFIFMPMVSIVQIANETITPPFIVMTLAFATVPLAIGLLLGRPCIRLLIRLLLPARHCSALSVLWLCDDRPLPRPRRR